MTRTHWICSRSCSRERNSRRIQQASSVLAVSSASNLH
jgi:hypothetical protein